MAENQNFRVKNGLEIGGELIVAGTTVIDSSANLVDIGNITTSGYLRGPASFIIDPAAHGDDTGTVVIAGNLQVDGTTTTINSTTITLDDKNIVLASGAADSVTADGAGITVDGAAATLTYVHSGTKWAFNKPLVVPQLSVGDGTDGYFYSDIAGRTAFNGGQFYIQTGVSTYYNYATTQYHGGTSGDNHLFRGNPLSGDNWSITAAGAITATSLAVDNFTLDGTTLSLSSGDLILDSVAGDIHLDAAGNQIIFKGSAGQVGFLDLATNRMDFKVSIADAEMRFQGNDGGVAINALTLDMSNGGQAIFNKGASFVDHVYLADNAKAVFGASDDLQIYHDGTHSYVSDVGTGNLILKGTHLNLRDANNALYMEALQGGAVTLRHAGNISLATTATGIDVTGTATMDGLVVDGSAQFNTGAGGVAEFYHASGLGGLRVTGSATGSASTIFLSNDKSGTPFDIYSFWGNGGDDSLEFFSGGTPSTGTKRLRLANNGDISFYNTAGTSQSLFWDASAESLGIGTSSPNISYAVDATAGYRSAAALPNFTLVETDASNQTWQINSTAAKLSFRDVSRAADRIVVDTAGNVGIGTSSPSEKLEIAGAASATSTGIAIKNGSATRLRIFHDDNAGASYISSHDVQAAQTLFIRSGNNLLLSGGGGTEHARIDASGNVGIGTTAPASALSGSNVNLTMEDADGADIRFKRTSGVDFTVGVTSSNTAYVWNGGGHHMLFGTASTERMRIQSTGNVSIGGNTAPSYKLVVSNGNAAGIEFGPEYATDTNLVQHYDRTASAYMDVNNIAQNHRFGRASNEWMRIDSSGNVGIGTSSPALAGGGTGLHIYGTSYPEIKFTNSTTGSAAGDGSLIQGNGNNLNIHNREAGVISLATSNTERMRIDASGNVGIGTTAPERALHVVGGIHMPNANVLSWDAADGTLRNTMYVDSGDDLIIGDTNFDDIYFSTGQKTKTVVIKQTTGNVGIGTITPGYTLEVAGSFAATTKSFVIDHPTKEGMKLRYGSLEGPENGVYVRGRLKDSNVIELPDYWTGLVHEDSITVSLTAIGKSQELYVIDINDNKVTVGGGDENINCFYTIFAERKDVEKLEVEYK